MYERDRRTDRRTDGHRMTAKAALDAIIARQKLQYNILFTWDNVMGHVTPLQLCVCMSEAFESQKNLSANSPQFRRLCPRVIACRKIRELTDLRTTYHANY